MGGVNPLLALVRVRLVADTCKSGVELSRPGDEDGKHR